MEHTQHTVDTGTDAHTVDITPRVSRFGGTRPSATDNHQPSIDELDIGVVPNFAPQTIVDELPTFGSDHLDSEERMQKGLEMKVAEHDRSSEFNDKILDVDLSATSDAIQKIDKVNTREYNLSTNQKVQIASGHFSRGKIPLGVDIDVP